MSLSRSLGRAILASAILSVSLFSLGWLFHADMDRPGKRLQFALARSEDALRMCRTEAEPDVHDALVVYLAIEDYFRPAEIRRLEFLFASSAAYLHIPVVNTLGIGQISKETFISTRDSPPRADEELRHWIEGARDDCENVAVLRTYAHNNQIQCYEQGLRCVLHLTCFWHTGRRDSCLGQYRDRGYAEDVIASYSRIVRSNRAISDTNQD